jgi:hypothetical protein
MSHSQESSWADVYHRHFLAIELGIAALIAVLFWAAIQFSWRDDGLAESLKGIRQPVYTSVVSLAGSLLGFVIASIPIILGFGQFNRLKIVRASPHYGEIFRIFFQAIYWLSFAIIWALICIIVDKDETPKVWASFLMVFFFLALVSRVFRCVWVLRKITLIATKEAEASIPHGS